MAKSNNLKDFLTDVADAIRSKTGESGLINPQDFSAKIASIQTGGGGGDTPTPSPTPTPDYPVIGDGKTYLYIKIATEGRMTVPLYFSQTVANGVTIDWGDGSATQTLSGTGNRNTTHTYAEVGEYVISLDPADDCTLGLGHGSTSYCVLGSTGESGRVYCNMLQAVEIGNNMTSIRNYAFNGCYSLASVVIPNGVTSIGDYAFYNCYSLASVVIPNSVTSIGARTFYSCYSLASVVIPNSMTSIGTYAFNGCYSLASVVIPNGVTSIGDYTFNYCYSLASVVIPNGVTSIGTYAFYSCYSLASVVIPNSVTSIGARAFYSCCGMTFYDFSQATAVPSLANTNAFNNIPSDCKIIVPDTLYDEWIAATNWSTYASKIVKDSEFIR
jgi:hypothetical protein